MDLTAPATEDTLDDVTLDHIRAWAGHYLPAPSAEGFAEWIDVHIGDWVDGEATVHQILTVAYQEWTGHDLPTPDHDTPHTTEGADQ